MIVDPPFAAGRRLHGFHALLIVATAVWWAIPGIDFRSIENHEHARFARVAQNILWSGDWIVLVDGGEPFRHAPPLLAWLIAVASMPFGHVTAWSARLAPIFASMVAGLATYGIGHRLADRTVGLMAALLLLSTWRWPWSAHSIAPDMLAAATVACALYCAIGALGNARPALWWAGTGAAGGLGVLAGGTIAPLIVCLVLVVAWRSLAANAAPPWRALAVGIGAGAPIVGPWALALAGRAGWGDVWASISPHALTPEVGPMGEDLPAWWPSTQLPLGFLPWTALWPGLLVALRPASLPQRWGRALWLGLAWAFLPILALPVAHGATASVLLCAYPGWALLCGLLTADVLQRFPSYGGWRAWFVPRLAIAGACLVLLWPVLAVTSHAPAVFAPVARVMGVMGGLLALMATYLLLIHRGPARVRVAVGIVLVASLGVHAAYLRVLGLRDPAESPYRRTTLHLRALAAGYPLTGSAAFDRRLVFYFDEAPPATAAALRRRLEADRPVACLVLPAEWSALEGLAGAHVHAVHPVFAVDVPALLLVSHGREAGRDVAILPPESLGAARPRVVAAAAPSDGTR